MALLPSEIILSEILPRSPARSLLRFKCASKTFETQISCPEFINLHLRHSLFNVTNRLLILNLGVRGLCCVDLGSPTLPKFYLPLPHLLRTQDYTMYTVGSCNGLVCMRAALDDTSLSKFMLINPCTGVFITIPDFHHPNTSSFVKAGFGYDSLNKDYKIVSIVVDDGSKILVYSLNDNDWRFVENASLPEYNSLKCKNGVLINDHLLHWTFFSNEKKEHRIDCFNLQSEQWVKDVALPDYHEKSVTQPNHFAYQLFEDCRDRKSDVVDLGVLDGCLCVLTENPEHYSVDVWVMKEYGLKESWVKIMDHSDSRVTKRLKFCPLSYRAIKKTEVLVMMDAEFVWYNIQHKIYTKAGQILKLSRVKGFDACVCHGSLVVLPGGQQIVKE